MGVVVKLWTKYKRADGRSYVAVVVNYKSYRRVINSQVYLLPNEWDANRSKIRRVDQFAKTQQMAINKIAEKEEMRVMQAKIDFLSQSQFKALYHIKAVYNIHEAAQDYLRSKTDVKDATKGNYLRLYNVLKNRVPNVELKNFGRKALQYAIEMMLEDGWKPISANVFSTFVLSFVRHAKSQGQNIDETIFNYKKLKVEAKKRKNIQDAVLIDLWRNQLQKPAVRLFFVSLFCQGVDLRDLWYVLYSEGDFVEITRSKTGQKVIIKVLPIVARLLDGLRNKYQKEQFINYNKYRSLYHTVNNELEKSTTQNVTVKLCRHTWATKAISLGVAKSVVAKALAHSQQTITDVYISKQDFQDVFEANNLVVSHFLELFGELNS